ncbi:glycosyltransferase family 15 protein [Hysterangium stoloniferum]|nr:glycosyltransferase family 15 protein [Hysterangium stoloniferum]
MSGFPVGRAKLIRILGPILIILDAVCSTSEPLQRRANATFVMLVRNDEVNHAISSIKQVEDRFNHRYNYPWVFLNDEPFSDEFVQRTSILTDGNVSYGFIPKSQWSQPAWIDSEKADKGRQTMIDEHVFHGVVRYQNMCTYNSGFFYHHKYLEEFRWYWRVEPDVDFYCDIDYDPFLYMEDNNKTYGFTITLYEFERTVRSLWGTVKEFIKEHPQYINPDNAMGFISDNDGESYNMCHFWSNFEIADMDFWRSEAYSKYFDYLYKAGGFYYERWGDAPVHSIAASLFLPKSKLHFFSDIGYRHSVYTHCPQGEVHTKGKCWCNPADNFDYQSYSCMRQFDRIF